MNAGSTNLSFQLSPPAHARSTSRAPRAGLPPSVLSATNPTIAILGVPFDNVSMTEAIQAIEKMIASGLPHYVVTANVDFVVQARDDVELRHILFDAHLVLCDGTPLLWASRVLGNPLRERVAGSDLVPLLIARAAEKRYRLFFLGATPESATGAVKRMETQYPRLIIAGHYSPPFNKLLEMDHNEITRRIREANPDVLLVSFGCPKQEKWIAMHYRSLGAPVSIGVGATIDFLAGQVKRAPRWMQRTGTEWIFRLVQEPRRLFKRYSKDLRVFAWWIFRQWWQLQFRRRQSMEAPGSGTSRPAAASRFAGSVETRLIKTITAPERLDLVAVQGSFSLEELACADADCILDLSSVSFIDSSGVGWLIALQKSLRSNGKRLVLLGPSESVKRALSLMRLNGLFHFASDPASAAQTIQSLEEEQASAVSYEESASTLRIHWRGEITAANAEEVWEKSYLDIQPLLTRNISQAPSTPRTSLTLDLSEVRFIDSTGLGLMIRLKKMGTARGFDVHFIGLQTAVQNVVRLARVEHFLIQDNAN